MLKTKLFYYLKPLIPRSLQLFIRRQIVLHKRKRYAHIWPIDPNAGNPPQGWKGWPDNKQFSLVLSHDVDNQKGHDACRRLMDLEEELGFRSSINIVPERYKVSEKLLQEIKDRGFELCVHGLNHDGKLFLTKKIFAKRAVKINAYIKKWGSVGFTSPSMHHNLDWMHLLNIQHATSTFDTDPFEPQPDSVKTIFPFAVNGPASQHSRIPSSKPPSLRASQRPGFYIELPYTLPQDFTLFVIMGEKNNDIWKEKLDWIVSKGGMALFNSHPDYMQFNQKSGLEAYPIQYYSDFLMYTKNRYKDEYWHALPSEVAHFWSEELK